MTKIIGFNASVKVPDGVKIEQLEQALASLGSVKVEPAYEVKHAEVAESMSQETVLLFNEKWATVDEVDEVNSFDGKQIGSLRKGYSDHLKNLISSGVVVAGGMVCDGFIQPPSEAFAVMQRHGLKVDFDKYQDLPIDCEDGDDQMLWVIVAHQ